MPSFVMLMLAICAVWLPAAGLTGRRSVPPWLPLLLLAVTMGLLDGQLRIVAVLGIAVLGMSAWGSTHARCAWQRRSLLALALLLALLMAVHRWPGFINTLVVPPTRITDDARPFMLYANVDKGVAGLLLLALLAPRCRGWREWDGALRQTLLPGLFTIALVMGLGWFTGLVSPTLKWPGFTPQFLTINLLLTVVAEEAFFRGVIQHRLQQALQRLRAGAAVALGLSALLFGAAHLGGGLAYAALATVAGVGYGWVFQRTGRIEAAIVLHFALNAAHFIGFTYPALA